MESAGEAQPRFCSPAETSWRVAAGLREALSGSAVAAAPAAAGRGGNNFALCQRGQGVREEEEEEEEGGGGEGSPAPLPEPAAAGERHPPPPRLPRFRRPSPPAARYLALPSAETCLQQVISQSALWWCKGALLL